MMEYMAILVVLFAVTNAGPIQPQTSLDQSWLRYKLEFKKVYQPEEEPKRRLIWEENLKKIEVHNREAQSGVHTYTLGLNKFADMTVSEFSHLMNGYRMPNGTRHGSTFIRPSNVRLPDTVDWRKEGYVTPVKNQGQCGSCWAFSTTGSLEGQYFKKTGQLVSLSEQNLVDCSGKEGNMGCNGGLMDQAFEYILKNNGLDNELAYPYEAVDGKCRFRVADVSATDTGHTDVKSGSESDLLTASATVGPISVAIDASHDSFQLYKSGVYYESGCSTSALDHGVLVVGYGTDNGQDYWLVKNSWGADWGMDGYLMMSRNKDNNCGIATQASYPLV